MATIETLVVVLIVAVSTAYSAWRLTSTRFHLRVIDVLGKLFGGGPGGWVAGIRNRELSKLGGSCGACPANAKLKVHDPSR